MSIVTNQATGKGSALVVSRSRAKPGSYSALTTSTRYGYVHEHIDISALPEDALG